jgi:hypothetical protein
LLDGEASYKILRVKNLVIAGMALLTVAFGVARSRPDNAGSIVRLDPES